MTSTTQESKRNGEKRTHDQIDQDVVLPPTLPDNSTKLSRFRHPSHPHKLFRNLVRNMAIFCDNQNCKRRLYNNEVSYVCFRCNYDLCQHCFLLPTEAASVVLLHESDDDVNEDVLFVPDRYVPKAKTVRILTEEEKLNLPENKYQQEDPGMSELLNNGNDDDDDDDDDEDDEEEEEEA